MVATIISLLMPILMKVLRSDATADLVRDFGDRVVGFVESKVIGSESKVDDTLVLPLLKILKAGLGNLVDGSLGGGPDGTQGDLLESIVPAFLKLFSQDTDQNLARKFGDMALDFIEDKVEGSKSRIDDLLVLPICELIRATAKIPDND